MIAPEAEHSQPRAQSADRTTAQRDVAQLGSALDWGSRGRRFKSCHPDRKALVGAWLPPGLRRVPGLRVGLLWGCGSFPWLGRQAWPICSGGGRGAVVSSVSRSPARVGPRDWTRDTSPRGCRRRTSGRIATRAVRPAGLEIPRRQRWSLTFTSACTWLQALVDSAGERGSVRTFELFLTTGVLIGGFVG